jgi:hypothetical protein
MADETRPSPDQAQDPSNAYERSHPGREAGMGRLDNNDNATPADSPDRQQDAVTNRQDGSRQLNAHDVVNQRGGPAPEQPDHSMEDDDVRGEDLAPTDIHDPRFQRHPRREGRGGTP